MSPVQLRTRLRLERGRNLVETTFLSVKEIASQVGMSNESQFIRYFKKAFGAPPNVYQSQVTGACSRAQTELVLAKKCNFQPENATNSHFVQRIPVAS
jgi:AraC-like DNA-binding protein